MNTSVPRTIAFPISCTSILRSASTARRASLCARGEAPLRDGDVPLEFEDDIALNALVLEHKDQFVVPAHTDKPQPTPDEVTANKRRWT